MAVRLTVSDVVTFKVEFTVPDNGVDKAFAFELKCKRVSPIADSEVIIDYLLKRAEAVIDRWHGDPLLVDSETGAPVIGAEALEFLFKHVGATHVRALQAYAEHTNAKAKVGNSPG